MNDNRFTQEEQTEIVRMAATLEIAIEDEKKELNRLRNEVFKSAPQPPVKREISTEVKAVAPDYSKLPKINGSYEDFLATQCKADNTLLNKIYSNQPVKRALIATPVLFFIWLVVIVNTPFGFLLSVLISLAAFFAGFAAIPLAFVYKSKYDKKYNDWLAASHKMMQADPTYQRLKAEADQEAEFATQRAIDQRKQEIAQNEREFKAAVEEYNTEILPRYEKERQKWIQAHNLKIQMIQNDLNSNTTKLNSLYNQTKMISTHYREIPQLVWIYEEMSQSQHDFDAALQLLNDDTTHNLLRGVISHVDNMHSDMMQGMQSIYMQLDAINNQSAITNEILDEMSERLRKTRRDMNIGNIVGVYQRRKFRKEFEEFRRQFA